MRRILIVSPSFPPVNSPDCHRARLLSTSLDEFGWEVEVLAVNPDCIGMPQDKWLVDGLGDVPVHRSFALSLNWSWIPGLGSICYRSKPFIYRLGSKILKSRKFDIVYFSTTVFGLTTLGPVWKRNHGVPYVIDYQDPWTTDYYRNQPLVLPPGGRLKYKIAELISRQQEPRVLRECSGITAVSPEYSKQLMQKHPFFQGPNIVLPFPGSLRDLYRIESEAVSQSIFDPTDGNEHWICAGASGPIMYKVLGSLFRALAIARNNGELSKNLRLLFVGTSYARNGSPVVVPLAAKYGLEDIVIEHPTRVPYSTALKCLIDANAIIATGSNDRSYIASKILPYILVEKPFLSIFHKDSPASQLLRIIGGSTHIEFCDYDNEESISHRIQTEWLSASRFKCVNKINHDQLEPYMESGHAEILATFLDKIVSKK